MEPAADRIPWNKAAPWTTDEEACLRLAIRDGKSAKFVATQIDRSLVQIKRKAYKLGLNFYHTAWTQNEIDFLHARVAAGDTAKQAASRLGRDLDYVRTKAKKLSLHFKRFGAAWTEECLAEFRDLVAQKLSATAIGERMGRSRNSIVSAAHRYGLKLEGRPVARKKPPAPKKKREKVVKLALAYIRAQQPQPLPQPEITANPVTFTELATHHCRWPVDAGLYCGANREHGPYCMEHAARGTR